MNLRAKQNKFDKSCLNPKSGLKQAMAIFFSWGAPAFLSILLMSWLDSFFPITYLNKAVEEGLSPIFWNVLGVLGVILFGFAIIFSSVSSVSKVGNRVLENTYAIGCLMFGFLVGQVTIQSISATLEYWQWWMFGATFSSLFIVFFFFNFALWYLSYLIGDGSGKSSFLAEIEKMGFLIRICSGLIFVILPIIAIIMKR